MNRLAKTKEVARRIQLTVKLFPQADGDKFVRSLSGAPGIRRVIQTFPDESDRDLASLFIIEVDPSSVQATLLHLRKNSAVEYAEAAAPRKLIR